MKAYAVLLVPADRPDRGFRFLVFSHSSAHRNYQSMIFEKSDDPGAGDVFIRKIQISDFFDNRSRSKFNVGANEAILIVEAGESQYGADVYFWTKNGYRHEPIDY
jgi:hypothetical protein